MNKEKTSPGTTARAHKAVHSSHGVPSLEQGENLVETVYIPTLESLLSVFQMAAEGIQSEILRLKANPRKSLSKQVTASTVRSLYKAEQLIWLIADTSKQPRESILLQVARGYAGVFHDEKHETRKERQEVEAAVAAGVEIRQSTEGLVIRMPLLPPRGTKHTTVATDMLGATIMKAYDELPRWSSCSLTITHVFPTAISRMPKDVDNYDYKRVIDLICYGIGCPDCAATCSVQLDTYFTDDLLPGTYILVEKKRPQLFEKRHWLEGEKLVSYGPEIRAAFSECSE